MLFNAFLPPGDSPAIPTFEIEEGSAMGLAPIVIPQEQKKAGGA
jgi:hypothetical protein